MRGRAARKVRATKLGARMRRPVGIGVRRRALECEAMTTRVALLLLFVTTVACARESSVERAARTKCPSAPVAERAVVVPSPPLPSLSSVEPPPTLLSPRAPSVELLHAIAGEHQDVHEWLDVETGVALVVVGPAYDPQTGTASDLRKATKLCGTNLARNVLRELTTALRNIHSAADMRCEDLRCIHLAAGEWDSQERLEFARKDGRLVLIAIERVLDVPMRDGAGKDIAWAARQRESLTPKRCP